MSTTRKPSDSPIVVTHSESAVWKAIDADVLSLWPQATGYCLLLSWDPGGDASGNLAVLWDIFGPGTPANGSLDIDPWIDLDGAAKRAQAVFRMKDVLIERPDVVYRALDAPDQGMVRTMVDRAIGRAS